MADELQQEPRASGVSIEHVNLYYGDNHVLKRVNIDIEPGEFFAFLGPSGCGKTTLLRFIAGFGQARTGIVRIGNTDVTRQPPWRRNVGMVFQSYALWPHMTVRKNVAFGLEERKVPKREITRRVNAVLDLAGLSDLAERRPAQLSGGQQQRVALARTIVVEPEVLLLDEPLSNLDAKLRVQMRHELHALQRKLSITTVFVTHDQEEANTMADRIAVMEAGVIQQVGTPLELYDKPTNRFVANFLGTANVLDGKLVDSEDGTFFQSSEGIALPVSLGGNAVTRATHEEPCSVVLRPEHLLIRSAATGEEEPGNDGKVCLRGVVEHREFLGGLIRYAVNVRDRKILVDDRHQRGQSALPDGAKVVLALAPDQVMLLHE